MIIPTNRFDGCRPAGSKAISRAKGSYLNPAVAQVTREGLWASMSGGLDTDPRTGASNRIIGWAPPSGCCSSRCRRGLDLPDLLGGPAPWGDHRPQLGQGVGRHRLSHGCVQLLEPLRGGAQGWLDKAARTVLCGGRGVKPALLPLRRGARRPPQLGPLSQIKRTRSSVSRLPFDGAQPLQLPAIIVIVALSSISARPEGLVSARSLLAPSAGCGPCAA